VLRLNGERAAEGSRGLSSFFGRAPLAIAAAAIPPAAAVAKSDSLLSDALSHYFGDKNWHFTKTSKEGQERSAQLGFKSIVMDEMHRTESKFSFME
jgi:hypothetical protein